MTTCADLMAETHRYLLPTAQGALNTLNGSLNTSTTSIVLNHDVTAINAGSVIALDLELMYVWSVVTASKTLTVQRAMQGSAAAAHSDGALVSVEPRFSDFAVFQAINADLDDLSAPNNGLYAQPPTVVTLTYKPQINGYDLTALPSSFSSILRVRYDIPGPWKTWPEIRRWQIKRDAKTADFPSGTALVLYDQGSPGRDVRVTVAMPFTHFAATTDNTSVAGLATSMLDLPPLGAAARLSGVRETQRNQFEAQGDPRRATEVPPNAQLAGATALLRQRQMRIQAESARLASDYPVRRMVG